MLKEGRSLKPNELGETDKADRGPKRDFLPDSSKTGADNVCDQGSGLQAPPPVVVLYHHQCGIRSTMFPKNIFDLVRNVIHPCATSRDNCAEQIKHAAKMDQQPRNGFGICRM